MAVFQDRTDAGRKLARELEEYTGAPDVVVLALPRGGVPVAYEVAQALDAPLDIFLVRKLGLPPGSVAKARCQPRHTGEPLYLALTHEHSGVVGTWVLASYDLSRLRAGGGTTNRVVKANDTC
jgi:adenine/guanine phosphoribosyltransferase-like PRPP-binding protein